MSGKTAAFIVARLGSTRLPRKAIRPILGVPMIEQMIRRVREAKSIDEIVVATTTLPDDAELANLADSVGCGHFRASPDNVSRRVADAAEATRATTIVELLADNPLVHSDMIDDTVALFRERESDYAASVTREYEHLSGDIRRFPVGIRVQVYSSTVARRWPGFPDFFGNISSTAFIFRNPSEFKCDYLEARGRWDDLHHPDYHLAVNLPKNFELISAIFADLLPEDPNFGLPRVMEWIESHPEAVPKMGN